MCFSIYFKWYNEINRNQNGRLSLQWGHLNVVVPPDILNEADTNESSLDESVTNEGGQIQLVCIATGVPQPTVSDIEFGAIVTMPRFVTGFFFCCCECSFGYCCSAAVFNFKCLVT